MNAPASPLRRPVPAWALVVVPLGFLLVLWGNALPWPCLLGFDFYECAALKTYNLDNSALGLLLAAALLVTPFLSLLRTPIRYVAWVSFWILLYALTVLKLYQIMPGEQYGMPLVTVNQNLTGPASIVWPLSLLVLWLSIRPVELQARGRVAVMLSQAALILTTGYFYVFSLANLAQMAERARKFSPGFTMDGFLNSGPVLILLGCALLLAAEILQLRRERRAAAPAAEPPVPVPVPADAAPQLQAEPSPDAAMIEPEPGATAQAALPAKTVALQVAFWSAVVVAAAPLVLIALVWATNSLPSGLPARYGEYDFFMFLFNALQFLPWLGFAVMAAALYAHFRSKGRATGGKVILGCVAAYLLLKILGSLVLPAIPALQLWVYNTLPFLTRYGGLGALELALAALAGWLVLAPFPPSRLRTAARGCLLLLPVLAVIQVLLHTLSGGRLPPAASAILSLVIPFLIFPMAAILIALLIRREPLPKPQPLP